MGIFSIVILGILIFIHELGHFLVAKYYKVGVAEFAVGFGPKLLSTVWGDTRYSLRAIPLGGYVRMVGETPMDAKKSLDQEENSIEPHEKKLMEDKNSWFVSKKISARALVVFAGPLFNFIFAFILAILSINIYGVSKGSNSTVIGEVMEKYPAKEAGLLVGDKVLEINGVTIKEWKQIKAQIDAIEQGEILLKVERQGQIIDFTLKSKEIPPEVDYLIGTGQGKKTYMLGISPEILKIQVSFLNSFLHGAAHVSSLTWLNLKSIYGLIKGIVSPTNLGGPLTIINEAAKSASSGLERTLGFMVFLNVALAVLNLLPIPVLDGGHLTFYLIEAIRGKPLSLKVQETATKVGMFALLMLMVYALSNDIRNVFIN